MPKKATASDAKPIDPVELVRQWNALKVKEKEVEKALEKLKPTLKAALGEADDVPVRLDAADKGVWVIHRVRQDRRKPDLRELTRRAALDPGGALAMTQPGITETVLTEDGAAKLLAEEILSTEDLQSSMTGKLVEYAEVRFKEEGTDAPDQAG